MFFLNVLYLTWLIFFDHPILGKGSRNHFVQKFRALSSYTDAVFYSLVFWVGHPTLFAVFFDLEVKVKLERDSGVSSIKLALSI